MRWESWSAASGVPAAFLHPQPCCSETSLSRARVAEEGALAGSVPNAANSPLLWRAQRDVIRSIIELPEPATEADHQETPDARNHRSRRRYRSERGAGQGLFHSA